MEGSEDLEDGWSLEMLQFAVDVEGLVLLKECCCDDSRADVVVVAVGAEEMEDREAGG